MSRTSLQPLWCPARFSDRTNPQISQLLLEFGFVGRGYGESADEGHFDSSNRKVQGVLEAYTEPFPNPDRSN